MTNNNNKKFNKTLSNTKVSNLDIPKKAKKKLARWGLKTVGDVCAERSTQVRAMTGTSYPYISNALMELGIGIDNDGEFIFPEPSYEDIKYSMERITAIYEETPQNKIEKKKQLLEDYRDLKQAYDNLK